MNRYFDYAGSGIPFQEALKIQMKTAMQYYANPSALHGLGIGAKEEMDRLKFEFSNLVGFNDGRIILTSGATEANNIVIRGLLGQSEKSRVLVAADVHASIWNTCKLFKKRMDVIPLESDGSIRLENVAESLTQKTELVCLSHASNETGVIHNASAIADLCDRKQVLCLIDGTQSVGHIPVSLESIPCDFYTFSSHKFGGPRGIGGILNRSEKKITVMTGGMQEWGLRPGTENLPGFAGALEALRLSIAIMKTESTRLNHLVTGFIEKLKQEKIKYLINGDLKSGLPGFVSIIFPGLKSHSLVTELAMYGYAVTSGSACHSNEEIPSHIITAMGRTNDEALGTVRISFGRLTTQDSVTRFTNKLIEILTRNSR